MRFHGSRRVWLGLAAAAAVAVGAGAALGAIPDGGGTIHGCYNDANGRLRLTDAQNPKLQACLPRTETPVDWSAQGPAGPAGPAGPKGDPGPPAPAGTEVRSAITPVPPTGSAEPTQLAAACQAGQIAVSGGWYVFNATSAAPPSILASYRGGGSPSTWQVVISNPASNTLSAMAIAYCAPAS